MILIPTSKLTNDKYLQETDLFEQVSSKLIYFKSINELNNI